MTWWWNLPSTTIANDKWNNQCRYVPLAISGRPHGEYGLIAWGAIGDKGFPEMRYAAIHVESGADVFENSYAASAEECIAELDKIIANTSPEKMEELFAASRQKIEENANRVVPPAEKTKKGAIYLIKVADRYKLGQSLDPEKRIGSMQLPSKPEVVLIHHTVKYREAERELHVRFAHRRQHGEWFNFDSHELGAVQEAIRAY